MTTATPGGPTALNHVHQVRAGGSAQELITLYSKVLLLRRGGPEPLYYQLAQSVEEAVASGAIHHGSRLPPEKDIAKELRVAVSTVRRAWSYLERKGMLTRTRKSGTFVQ